MCIRDRKNRAQKTQHEVLRLSIALSAGTVSLEDEGGRMSAVVRSDRYDRVEVTNGLIILSSAGTATAAAMAVVAKAATAKRLSFIVVDRGGRSIGRCC